MNLTLGTFILILVCASSSQAVDYILGDGPIAPKEEPAKANPPFVAQGAVNFNIDINNREQVRAFYNAVYTASTNAVINWNGAIANCNAGTTAADFREKVRLRINFYRAMAGVPSGIVFDDVFTAKAQQAAFMMTVNNQVNHTPPNTWTCYTAEGREAAERSNLAAGLFGPEAIDGYITDRGFNNTSVGHRRWLFLPQTTTMGTGDIDFSQGNASSAVWVIDGRAGNARPPTRDGFVAWPPPGYMPSPIMPVRWSISFPNANFTAANVTLSSNGVPVSVTKETVRNGAGENTLVWFVTGMSTQVPFEWPRPASDVVFTVSVSGISGTGVPPDFSYMVLLFDPNRPGPDAVTPTLSGPDSVTVGQAAQFTFPSPTFATGHQLRVTPRSPHTTTDGAENLLVNFINVTSPSTTYSNIVTTPVNSGSRAFRLCHAGSIIQHLTYRPILFPREGAELRFASRLGRAATLESAKVQVSSDGGGTWADIFSQAGSGSSTVPTEASYQSRVLSLAAFVNRPIMVRFNFTTTGSFFNTAAADFGWYFDDISFVATDQLGESTLQSVPLGNSLGFTAASAGGYVLELRQQVWDEFYLGWGPGKAITATGNASVVIQADSAVTLTASQLQITFDISGTQNPAVKVFKSAAPNGPWEQDNSATFETLNPNTRFRATLPRPASATFYRPGI